MLDTLTGKIEQTTLCTQDMFAMTIKFMNLQSFQVTLEKG